MSKIQEIYSAVEGGKAKLIADLVAEAIGEGCAPGDILNNGMIRAMDAIGERFTKGDIFVPEMLIAARTMKKGMETLKPYLASGETGANGKVVIGTVAGDLHDIGKNLVGMMFESAGFALIDLGVDVTAEKYIETVRANPDVKIVALSTLLTTTMPSMRHTVKLLGALENRSYRIMVGGAPVTEAFAAEIGADGYSPDAAAAVIKAKELIA